MAINIEYIRKDIHEKAVARIAALEAQLAEAERTIGALKHLIGEQTDQIAASEEKNEGFRVATRDLFEATERLEANLSAALARAEEAEREKRMAMRLMRAREDRLIAILDTVCQNKGDDLVRVEVAYFLDCNQSEIEHRSTDEDIDAALRQAMGERGDE